MPVLYRKYRPQTFSEVLNQKAIIQTLKNQVKSGSVAHAYLFTGSRGVGKTSVARILAKAVNCEGNNPSLPSPQEGRGTISGDADGSCSICKQIENGNFIDLVEIDAASNTGVDNIRELIEHVKFAPAVGKYKVFIIDEVHMLSKGAFNALLKTLEEPPKHAIFILATTEINKVPATIVSRTQRFEFKVYSPQDLLQLLQKVSKEEKIEFSNEVLELVAEAAEGGARDALSLLDKVMTLGGSTTVDEVRQLLGITDTVLCENFLQMIAQNQAAQIPDFLHQLGERGLDYAIFNRDFLEYLRKALVIKVSDGEIKFNLSEQHWQILQSFIEAFSANDLIFIIRLFLKSYKDLTGAPNPEVPLLIAGIEAAGRRSEGRRIEESAVSRPASQQAGKSVDQPSSRAASRSGQSLEHGLGVSQQTSQEAVVESDNSESVLSLEQAQEVWPRIVAKVKDINGPLASLLKACSPQEIQRNKIIVSVKFLFDKQNLESIKNSTIISGAIESISGKKMSVIGQVIKPQNQEAPTAAEAISDALKVFGGELVE